MADKEYKYIEAWREVPPHKCHHIEVVIEKLKQDAESPGPHAALSDARRHQTISHLKENQCEHLKTGECELANFLTRKALEFNI